MTYLGGDGEWVVMSKCTATVSARARWTYRLFDDQLSALAHLGRMNAQGCGANQCSGASEHSAWRMMIVQRAVVTPAPPRNAITHTIALPSDCDRKDVNWFE
jgi:hypothetical protein